MDLRAPESVIDEEPCWTPRRKNAGFTLLEILIAIVILVVGITGIVALFPTAIKSGNQTIVDSYASIITQSVIDAITVGMREARYRFKDVNGESWDYFIFDHDGINDNLDLYKQPEMYSTVHDKDFAILLPRGFPANKNPDKEKTLHFPNPDPGNRSAPTIASLKDDEDLSERRFNTAGEEIFQVRRVYLLGRDNSSTSTVKPIRKEFLGDSIAAGGSSTVGGGEAQVVDPYPQYGYSFSISRAKIDTATPRGILDAKDEYSNSLFEVKIKIFRNFRGGLVAKDKSDIVPTTNNWVHEFVTLIST